MFATMALVVLCGHASGGIMSANNIADDWSLSAFRGDVGFTNNANFTNTARAQFFTASVGGAIESITTVVRRAAGYDGQTALRVSIHEAIATSNGHVPGAQVGSDVVTQGDAVPESSALMTLDFANSGVTLETGLGYHVVFHVDVATSGSQYSLAFLNATALNFGQTANFSPDAGQTWNAPNSGIAEEIGLRVEVVPAPSALALIGLGGLVASRRRRG